MTRRSWSALVLGALLTALALGLGVQGARQRLLLVWLRATGGISDIGWGEVFWMLPPGRVDIRGLNTSRNPFVTIDNPFVGPSDIATGQEVFRARCATCHGRDAEGGSGPDLTTGSFRRGASDWAVFRTVRNGVPNTAMQAHDLPVRAAWQVVAYVRSTASSEQPTAAPEAFGAIAPEVTFDRLRQSRGDSANWLTYSGTYDAQRHSRLSEINRSTVSHLNIRWIFSIPNTDDLVETSPLVIGNTMYVTAAPNAVWALDARTGTMLWSYSYALPGGLSLCCGRVNRGLAVLGNTLYLGTLDAHLLALDARTGAVQWKTKVAEYRDGYSITGAPLAIEGRVIVGVAGGEFGIRGFLDAYDPATGERVWRFYTVPGPGESGHDSWTGDSWKNGGAPTWMTGSYDPDLKLLYWGVGNPGPAYQGDGREGDNLYSNSVVALEAETGRLRWYFQFTPHDEHDYDATEIPVLVDATVGGRPRKLLLSANRNGFYYVLDRESGAFLSATEFVNQTWADSIGPGGRPFVRSGSGPSVQGTRVAPGDNGGTNWWSPSYHAGTGLFYVPALEQAGVFFKTPVPQMTSANPEGSAGQSQREPFSTAVRALDAATGKLRWEFRFPTPLAQMGGILSTAGGLVFAGNNTNFFALDANTGRELWRKSLDGRIRAAPITYLSEGRQMVTIAMGMMIVTYSLDGR